MESIRLQSRAGPDGILRLQIPVDLLSIDFEVMVIIQSLIPKPAPPREDLGWPPGFFEQTFGCLRDEPLVREPQGEYEIRDEML